MKELNQAQCTHISGGSMFHLAGIGVSLAAGFAGGMGEKTGAFDALGENVPVVGHAVNPSVAAAGALIGTALWVIGGPRTGMSAVKGLIVNGLAASVTYVAAQKPQISSLY